MREALAAWPSTTFGCTMQNPLNKHIQAQKPFHSTKKKGQPLNIILAKPTEEEKEKICEALLANKNTYTLFEDKMSHSMLKTIMHVFLE